METNETYPDLIYMVSASLDKYGFRTKVIEVHCKETPKSFVTPNKRISKEKLGKVDTKLISSHTWFQYYIFCREEDIEQSKVHLTETIKEKANKVKTEFEQVLIHLP